MRQSLQTKEEENEIEPPYLKECLIKEILRQQALKFDRFFRAR
jgi:hypothetical protein